MISQASLAFAITFHAVAVERRSAPILNANVDTVPVIGILPQPAVTAPPVVTGQAPSNNAVNAGAITFPETVKPPEPALGAPNVAPEEVSVCTTPKRPVPAVPATLAICITGFLTGIG